MTCVVYRDGVVACDAWALDAWTRMCRVPKIGKVGNLLYGWSGGTATGMNFVKWITSEDFQLWLGSDGKENGPPSLNGGLGSKEDEAHACLYLPDRSCLKFEGAGHCFHMTAPFFAMGSGAWIAIGAMEHGATAIQAVEAACTWDIGTTRPVHVFHDNSDDESVLDVALGSSAMQKFGKQMPWADIGRAGRGNYFL